MFVGTAVPPFGTFWYSWKKISKQTLFYTCVDLKFTFNFCNLLCFCDNIPRLAISADMLKFSQVITCGIEEPSLSTFILRSSNNKETYFFLSLF